MTKISLTRGIFYAIGVVLLVGVVLLIGAVTLGHSVTSTVHYIGHNEIKHLKLSGDSIVSPPGLVVLTTPGLVEYQGANSQVFIFAEGEAILVVGGTIVGPERRAAEQLSGRALRGGTTYHVSKGDVITMPAKTPYWFKELPTGSVAYYAVERKE